MSEKFGVPPFLHDDETIDIIKQAGRAIASKARVSGSRQAILMTEFAITNGSALHVYKFSLSKQQWCQLLSENKEIRHVPGSPDAPRVAWNWMFRTYPDIIGPIFRDANAPRKLPNPVAPALHEWLSPNKDFNIERLRGLAGRYALYRPHFLDAQIVLVSELLCGVDGDPSRFTIDMKYPVAGQADPTEESVEGYMVPYQECVLFQGMIVKTRAPFIFILSGFPLSADGIAYEESEGALLVGATGKRPSGYPVAIRRHNEAFEPYFATKEELADSHADWSSIAAPLDRGMVAWR